MFQKGISLILSPSPVERVGYSPFMTSNIVIKILIPALELTTTPTMNQTWETHLMKLTILNKLKFQV
ncbi:hypothetical protein C8255_10660 [filamentous cyanobacterium CCP3]|nr:hypothetical protein C8255_10660 [filamentous cyanobacterium CCP3]